MKYLKAHWPLVVGLGLPVVFILVIFLSVYIPTKTAKPSQDFVYVYGNYSGYGENYIVKDGKLVLEKEPGYVRMPSDSQKINYKIPEIYIYHVEAGESKKIDYSQAQGLKLNINQESRDGFRIEYGGGRGGLFFDMFGGGDRDYNSKYVSKGAYSKKLNLPYSSPDIYYSDFQFMGWVE